MGAGAFFKGAVAALSSSLIENGVVFFVNGQLRRLSPEKDRTPVIEAGLGALSGFFSATAICPAEVIKVRMQASLATAASRVSFVTCSAQIFKKFGVAGFFHGITALWSRDCLYYFLQFGVYHFYTQKILHLYPSVGVKGGLPAYHSAIGGGLGGCTAWAIVFPLDVVKSRKQVGVLSAETPILRALRILLRTEGLSALSRGWLPAILRGFPANSALFFGVEVTNRMLRWCNI